MGAWSMIDWNCASFARKAASASACLLVAAASAFACSMLRRSASLRARISRANMRQANSSRTPNAATMLAEITAPFHQAARISFLSQRHRDHHRRSRDAPVRAEVLRPAGLERSAHEAGRRGVLQARDQRIARRSRHPPRRSATARGTARPRPGASPRCILSCRRRWCGRSRAAVRVRVSPPARRRIVPSAPCSLRPKGMTNWPLGRPRSGGSAARPGSASVERRRKMFVSARDWPISAGTVEKTTMPFAIENRQRRDAGRARLRRFENLGPDLAGIAGGGRARVMQRELAQRHVDRVDGAQRGDRRGSGRGFRRAAGLRSAFPGGSGTARWQATTRGENRPRAEEFERSCEAGPVPAADAGFAISPGGHSLSW